VKRWLRSRLAKMLAGVLLAGLAATWAVGKAIEKREVDRRDQHKVTRMTDKMKTVCVGRFLIDMPEEAQLELRGARVDSFDIAGFDETEDEFQKRVADREAQLAATPDWRGSNKNLESIRDVKTSSGLSGKIFVHTRTVAEGTRGNGLGGVERYRDEGISTEALVHGHGISIDLFSEDRALEWIDDLPALVNQLAANPDNRIPVEPGFCMDRLYVREPLRAEQREQIMMFARLPSHPDVEIMFILGAGVKPHEHGLLARSEAGDANWSIAELMRVTKLRSAPREIGGLAGEELVERVIEANEARVHSFWWEVSGTEDNVLVPHLVFKMTTGVGQGKPVPSSLSDGAALGLWDKITSSIRLRPTQPVATSGVAAPATPLGTYASAGEPCPESGWWLCGDGGAGVGVLGGQRQYIRKGDTVPQALLLPPRTLWDKVRGVQPSFESDNATFWKLVDKRSQKRAPPSLALALPVAPLNTAFSGPRVEVNEQPHVSVGSFGVTGTPCPASGWWRCEQSHALDGTRWFAQGALLPPATFAVSPGVFGRSTNVPRTIRRRGEWRLVRLADASAQTGPDSAVTEPESGVQSVRQA
jgi:hypothetical protein